MYKKTDKIEKDIQRLLEKEKRRQKRLRKQSDKEKRKQINSKWS